MENRKTINTRTKIELLLLGFGLRPEGRGICAGIFFTFLQAFFSKNMTTYKNRINYIMNFENTNGFFDEDKLTKIKTILIDRSSKNYQSVLTPLEREQATDLLNFLHAIVISQIPRRYPTLFGRTVYQSEILEISKLLITKKLEELGGLIEVKANLPTLFNELFDRSQLKIKFEIFNDILSKNPIDLSMRLIGWNGSKRHIIGIFYQAENKSWILVDSDNFNIEPIKNIDELVELIFESLDSIDDETFSFFVLKNDEISIKLIVETFKNRLFNLTNSITNPAQQNISTNTNKPSLRIAAAAGRADIIEEYAKNGENLDQINNNMTAALIAARCNRANVIDILGKYGANLNLSCHGETPIFLAAKYGHVDVIKKLVDYNVELNKKDNYSGRNALLIATENWKFDCVKLLIDAKANLDCTTPGGKTAAFIAAEFGYADILEELAKAGADLNKSNSNNQTPILMAVNYGNLNAFEILLKYNATLNICSKFYESPLLKAIERGEIEMLELMFEHGLDFQEYLPNDKLPLDFAKQCNHQHVLEFIEQAIFRHQMVSFMSW